MSKVTAGHEIDSVLLCSLWTAIQRTLSLVESWLKQFLFSSPTKDIRATEYLVAILGIRKTKRYTAVLVRMWFTSTFVAARPFWTRGPTTQPRFRSRDPPWLCPLRMTRGQYIVSPQDGQTMSWANVHLKTPLLSKPFCKSNLQNQIKPHERNRHNYRKAHCHAHTMDWTKKKQPFPVALQ